jgi:hypothetical protein
MDASAPVNTESEVSVVVTVPSPIVVVLLELSSGSLVPMREEVSIGSELSLGCFFGFDIAFDRGRVG